MYFMSGNDPRILGQNMKNWDGIPGRETCFSLG